MRREGTGSLSAAAKPTPASPAVRTTRVALGASPRGPPATGAAVAASSSSAPAGRRTVAQSGSAALPRSAASTHIPHAIPFCMLQHPGGASSSSSHDDEAHVNDDEVFTITPEAIAYLNSITVPVIPIAVVGQYRTGKSFLMNKLLEGAAQAAEAQGDAGAAAALPEPSSGFAVGPTIEACTRGIWLWSHPIHIRLEDGTQAALLFLDTEGIGAAGATAEHDARIFALATLLCSLIIYNSVGAVDEDAIQGLAFIANLTRHIQGRSNGSGSSGEGGIAGGGAGAAGTALAATGSGGTGRLATVESLLIKEDKLLRAAEAAGGSATSHLEPPHDEEEEEEEDSDEDSDDGGAQRRRAKGKGSNYVQELRRKERERRAAQKAAQAARVHEELRRAISGGSGGAVAAAQAPATSRRASAVGVLAGATGNSAAVTGALPGTSDALEPSSFHPSFLWVLRDFSLDLVDAEDGYSPISARDYVEQCIAAREGMSADAQARNRVRRVFTSYFKERDAFTLVRPVETEGALQALERLPESQLRPEFVQQLHNLQTKLFGPGSALLRPKTIQGELLTGRMLGGLAQAYATAINRRAVPSIGNAWLDVSRVECLEARDKALASFGTAVSEALAATPLPLSEDALVALHAQARATALGQYDAKAVGPRVPVHRKELVRRIEAELEELEARNQTASETLCWRAARQLWGERIEPRVTAPSSSSSASASPSSPSYASPTELASDLSAFKQAYEVVAVGPAAAAVFGAFLVESLPSFFHALQSAHAAEVTARVAALQEEIAAARGAVAAAEVRAATFEKAHADLSATQRAAAVEAAKASQTAKIAGERAAAAEAKVAGLQKEADELRAALGAERAAHAATKISKLAAGEALGGGSNRASVSAPTAAMASDAVASFMRLAAAPPAATRAVAGRRLSASSPPLPLRPSGAEDFAAVQEGEFPPPASTGCCTVM